MGEDLHSEQPQLRSRFCEFLLAFASVCFVELLQESPCFLHLSFPSKGEEGGEVVVGQRERLTSEGGREVVRSMSGGWRPVGKWQWSRCGERWGWDCGRGGGAHVDVEEGRER